MAIRVLFYDGNKADLDYFVKKQNEVVVHDTDHRTRNLMPINSLSEMTALELPRLTPDIAFFDLYQGDDYDPYALLAAQHLWMRGSKSHTDNPLAAVYFLAPKGAAIPQEVHQALREGVACGIVSKENALFQVERLILEVRDSGIYH